MTGNPRRPFRIVIVEDEALIAMDLEAMITDEGHTVIGEAASLAEFQGLEFDKAPHLAFVDIQLAQNSSGFDVCRSIQLRWPDTAVVFLTANPKMIPAVFYGAHGVIPKPFSQSGLLSAIRFIEEGISNPPPRLAEPPSFTPAPRVAAAWAPR